ncbi:hypothetical protein Q2T40_18645 [Winogradskyella maritima]|uniref:Uncharacterized protein n=1 Tax=Winogradskyella maritima TaxID=1517766 RepID=A0ABV8AHN6_9FLAO|nr:hypothetical protein [Winogradskyella maritima]
MKNFVKTILLSLILTSCGQEIDLDKENKTELGFNQLPEELKEIYSTKFSLRRDTVDYYIYSLDTDYELSHYWSGMNNDLISKGFNHHFTINQKEFKLGANQGDPFVLKDKKLYYTTELNLDSINFTNATYIVIDLKNHLE